VADSLDGDWGRWEEAMDDVVRAEETVAKYLRTPWVLDGIRWRVIVGRVWEGDDHPLTPREAHELVSAIRGPFSRT
jgi:hypothetical protein